MDAILKSQTLQLFLIFVFPGLISMHIYRLLMPARSIEWKSSIIEGLFFSITNFALLLPFIVFITYENFPTKHPIWFSFGFLIVLLIGPIIWPLVLVKAMRYPKLMKGLMLPFPTAWDAFFDKRMPVFVLIHLKNGKMIGGYFGMGSYAAAYPHHGDIYVKAVYKTDDKGQFVAPIQNTRGLHIRKAEYSYIEFFDVPPQEKEVK